MDGHHLILGEIRDYLTGETLQDTHDERYRQKIARFLVEEKGYAKEDIRPRTPLMVSADSRKGQLWVDFVLSVHGRAAMVIQYAPGSLVTRHRSTLAISRLLTPYQIPVVVVTNGETADILDGKTGSLRASRFDGIPSRDELEQYTTGLKAVPVSIRRAEMESRIAYAYVIDGACPCDDTTCKIA